MNFDATVVEVKTFLILFRLALAILCMGRKPRYMQQVVIHQKQPIYYLNFLNILQRHCYKKAQNVTALTLDFQISCCKCYANIIQDFLLISWISLKINRSFQGVQVSHTNVTAIKLLAEPCLCYVCANTPESIKIYSRQVRVSAGKKNSL